MARRSRRTLLCKRKSPRCSLCVERAFRANSGGVEQIRVLIVGAGAVGQVLGHHLQLGGANVTFFVRDKYRQETARGFDLCRLRVGREKTYFRFDGFDVVTSAGQVQAAEFDQVYLTVPSSALAGPWLGELAAALGDATVISLQAGPTDRATLIESGVAETRLVFGFVGFFSYRAPLPGERGFPKPATAHWLPALSPTLFSGPKQRSIDVVGALRRGGLPARTYDNLFAAVAFPTAIVMSYLLTLEAANWSLRGFTEPRHRLLAAAGARETIAIVGSTSGSATSPRWRTPLVARALALPRFFAFFLRVAGLLVPFPLEAYLRAHFTKVRAQTVDIVQALIARGKAASLDVQALEHLVTERTESGVQ